MEQNISLLVEETGIQLYDLVWENNTLALATGREELKQSILLRAIEQKGDWFYDPDFGLPWVEHDRNPLGPRFAILGSKPPKPMPMVELLVRGEMSKEKRGKITGVTAYPSNKPKRLYTIEVGFKGKPADPFRVVVNI